MGILNFVIEHQFLMEIDVIRYRVKRTDGYPKCTQVPNIQEFCVMVSIIKIFRIQEKCFSFCRTAFQ